MLDNDCISLEVLALKSMVCRWKEAECSERVSSRSREKCKCRHGSRSDSTFRLSLENAVRRIGGLTVVLILM